MLKWATSVVISTIAVPVCVLKLVTDSIPCWNWKQSNPVLPQDAIFDSLSNERTLTAVKERSKMSISRKPLPKTNAIKQPGEYITLKHGNTHYILQGPKEGKLVVMLHGISVYSFIWINFANLLEKQGYRVLMFGILKITSW